MTCINGLPFLGMPGAKIVLASASVARQNIMRAAGLEFDVLPSSIDEDRVRADALADGMMVEDIAVLLAFLKAEAISRIAELSNTQNTSLFVIGCDQILSFNNQLITKPDNLKTAKNQLLMLNGERHELLSAIVLIRDGQRIWHHLARTSMTMRKFDEAFVDAYIHHIGHLALQSPGAYQIESVGSSLFEKIDGDYFDTLGLPLFPLLAILNEHGLGPVILSK